MTIVMESEEGLKYLNLKSGEIKTFQNPLLTYLPEEVLLFGKLASSIEESLSALDDLASPEVIKKRAGRFDVGLDDEIFSERVIRLNPDKIIIAGLRFRKLNVEFPFVHVTANFVIDNNDIDILKETVRRAFHPAKFRGMTFRQGPNSLTKPHQMWSHTLFGKTDDLGEKSGINAMTLNWEKSIAFYADYETEYQLFLEQNPDKKVYLRFETIEDLKESANKNLLLSLYDHNAWGGVIAGKEDDLYGLPCIYIFEIFLASAQRGKKLAKHMQMHFLQQLSKRFSYVLGHIDDSNKPSLRTAMSLNRKIVETEYFVPFL